MSKEIQKSGDMPIDTMERMAESMANSNLFGVKKKEEMLSLMLLSQAEGRHPALCAKEYHIIQGRPTLSADAMLARFQQSGGKVNWTKYEDTEVEGEFSHSQGGSVVINWTIERAKNAGITSKDTWKKYPRNMLRSRCVTEGIRTVFPAICTGVYTPEEAELFNPEKPNKPFVETEVMLSDREINLLIATAEEYGLTPNDLTTYWKSELDDLPKSKYDKVMNNKEGAFNFIRQNLGLNNVIGDKDE